MPRIKKNLLSVFSFALIVTFESNQHIVHDRESRYALVLFLCHGRGIRYVG